MQKIVRDPTRETTKNQTMLFMTMSCAIVTYFFSSAQFSAPIRK